LTTFTCPKNGTAKISKNEIAMTPNPTTNDDITSHGVLVLPKKQNFIS